jgi:uncharacterized protein YndB with AHSA1/START domain
MIKEVQQTSVHVQVVVEAPIEQAFTVFTEGIGTWFPPDYNLLAVPIAERVFEPRVGGRVYDRGVDGSDAPGHACWSTTRSSLSSWRQKTSESCGAPGARPTRSQQA